jgi:hypothetical protein
MLVGGGGWNEGLLELFKQRGWQRIHRAITAHPLHDNANDQAAVAVGYIPSGSGKGADLESVITIFSQNRWVSVLYVMVVELVIPTVFIRSLHDVGERNSYRECQVFLVVRAQISSPYFSMRNTGRVMIKLGVHGSVHHSTDHIEITNKMQPYARIYYFSVS